MFGKQTARNLFCRIDSGVVHKNCAHSLEEKFNFIRRKLEIVTNLASIQPAKQYLVRGCIVVGYVTRGG